MSTSRQTFKTMLEAAQWVIIGALLLFLIKILPLCRDYRDRQHQQDDVYKQIYNDQRLQKLKRINDTLSDSIQTLNSGSSVQVRYITVRDTVIITDTVFLA